MLKLYKLTDAKKEYWETWENENGSHSIHWGVLGEKGESKVVKTSLFKKVESIIQKEIDELLGQGFHPVDEDEHIKLMIEYTVNGMGTDVDIEKRQRLENRMNETLGWTGLGHCDGGSMGSGSMEVCNYVVDYEIAKTIIENDLRDTDFANFKRIYNEKE